MLERDSRSRLAVAVAACALTASMASGQNGPAPFNGCASLPGYTQLKAALTAATIAENSGLNNRMWGTIVDATEWCARSRSPETTGPANGLAAA